MEEPPSTRSKRGTLAGEIVAGHELLRVVAAGGMGEVYLARHLTLGMNRAVKVIRTDLRTRERSRERFTREAQVLARLNHNSIVQIIEFGELANGWPFLAMEYIDGPSLEQIVEDGPLPLASALVVLEQIAVALQHAHSLGVVHRDLKPSNILVRSGDLRQVKIIDFGLARLLDEDIAKRLTADGQPIGSPAYMAPEQVEGVDEITAAVDVYALAGVAYKLLSGQPPFHFKNPTKLMAAHVTEPPPRLSERCSDIPAFLDSLFHTCLAKDPTGRPRSDEIVQQLGRAAGRTNLDGHTAPRDPVRLEIVASPWGGMAGARKIIAQVLETPPPNDPHGVAVSLAVTIMAMIGEIATYLSTSDPELTSLLRLESRIREQLANVERESLAIAAQLLEATDQSRSALTKHRDALVERARTLRVQQLPLQRRMIDVVEGHRRYAAGPIKALFEAIDQALEQLDTLRRA